MCHNAADAPKQYSFPDMQTIIASLEPYEQDFARREYGRGLQFYLDRLNQLSFFGEHVLDAGCGQGQWTIALAHRFVKVEALDINTGRLGVLSSMMRLMGLENISPQQGSIEELPYRDNLFDAVFCYGVIMFTNLPRVLDEFHRVLKPGGRLYVCLNADGWNHYLLEERGKDNPSLQEQARQILYSTYWMRYGRQLADAYRDEAPQWMRFKYQKMPSRLLTKLYPPGARSINTRFLALGGSIEQQLCRDIRSLIKGANPNDIPVGIPRAYFPEDIAPLLNESGFTGFCWAAEGYLQFSNTSKVPSIYEPYYKHMLSVWEFSAVKPAKKTFSPLDLLDYLNSTNGLLPPMDMQETIVSNTMRLGVTLWQHWNEAARTLGEEEFLSSLTAVVIKDAKNERERFEAVMRFVQRRIFRDPVFQPLNPDGTLPSALAILLSGRGRCGHCVTVLTKMLQVAGIRTELMQLPRHVSLKALVEERWVLAEVDAFKNGIIPTNRQGQLIGIDDIHSDPIWLDRFPATGWRFQRNSKHVLDPWGKRIHGYVDSMDWHERGYTSGYFLPEVNAAPPQVPDISLFERKQNIVRLEWTPSLQNSDPLLHYEVFVGTTSRGWEFDDVSDFILSPLPQDIYHVTTKETTVSFPDPNGHGLYASVKAIGRRALEEPSLWTWPSEESFLKPSKKHPPDRTLYLVTKQKCVSASCYYLSVRKGQ